MNEQLSALIDDQLDEVERAAALSALGADEAMRAAWERYHLVGAALRGEAPSAAPERARRIADAIDRERRTVTGLTTRPVVRLPAATARRRSLRPAWGWALAASVMLAVAFGYQAYWDDAGESGTAVAGSSGVRWHNVQPEVGDQLTGLLVEHGEFTPVSGMNGLLAYAKVVSYDTGR